MAISSSTKVVVVGGTSGIGLAVARAAAAAGAPVIIGSSSEASVKRALGDVPGLTGGIAVDVTDPARLDAFFAEVGAFHHLVYTAGDPTWLNLVRK